MVKKHLTKTEIFCMSSDFLPISVTMLTKNSARHLHQALRSLLSFKEVIIYDTGSEDETLEIARSYPNVTLHQGPLEGFGPTHNRASAMAAHDWILSIDSDERLSEELLEEIKALRLDEKAVYSFPRKNFYKGKWIRWCGWHPDRQLRLFHRKHTRFTEAHVHEAVILGPLKHIPLRHPVYHHPYENTADFLHKMQTYSTLFAQQNQGKRSSSLRKAIGHGSFAFFKSYFLKRGFMGGHEGFVISFYNANTAFYKYLKLAEISTKVELE